jgi:hypothetical protein
MFLIEIPRLTKTTEPSEDITEYLIHAGATSFANSRRTMKRQ